MKYKHNSDTKIALDDIKNRLQQFIEISERTGSHEQKTAFQSAKVIVQQVIDTGHVGRGNDYFPDSLEEYATTSNVTEQLGGK